MSVGFLLLIKHMKRECRRWYLFVYLTRSPALCHRDVRLHGQSGSFEVSGAQHASSEPRHTAVHVSPSQTVGACSLGTSHDAEYSPPSGHSRHTGMNRMSLWSEVKIKKSPPRKLSFFKKRKMWPQEGVVSSSVTFLSGILLASALGVCQRCTGITLLLSLGPCEDEKAWRKMNGVRCSASQFLLQYIKCVFFTAYGFSFHYRGECSCSEADVCARVWWAPWICQLCVFLSFSLPPLSFLSPLALFLIYYLLSRSHTAPPPLSLLLACYLFVVFLLPLLLRSSSFSPL